MSFPLATHGQPTPRTPSPAPPAALKVIAALKEVRPVQLEKAVSFWRYGKMVEAQDLILLRVMIEGLAEFLPRGIGPPLFLYGDWVCLVLQDPLGSSGEAVLLAPFPAQDETPVLWLSPRGMSPQELHQETTRAYR